MPPPPPPTGKPTNGPAPADASSGAPEAGSDAQVWLPPHITLELSMEVWGRLEAMSRDLGRSIAEIAAELIEQGVHL